MEEEKINLKLRSRILRDSLILERYTSNIIKLILRIVKPSTKTLDNKSSSLSFKNKIDILNDLDELDQDYKHFIKFGEIRNQFIHYYDCNSFTFIALSEHSEYTDHLNKFPNDEKDQEKSFIISYGELYKKCEERLLKLLIKYKLMVSVDIQKYVNSKLIEDIDNIIETAKQSWKEKESNSKLSRPIGTSTEIYINEFISTFKTELLSKGSILLSSINDDELMEIVARKKL